jgi:hypothetical protein
MGPAAMERNGMNRLLLALLVPALLSSVIVRGFTATNSSLIPDPTLNPNPAPNRNPNPAPNPNPNLNPNLNPNPNPAPNPNPSLVPPVSPTTNAEQRATVIIVVGAPGEEEYGKAFAKAAELWVAAAQKGGAKPIVLGLDKTNNAPDCDKLKQALANEPKESGNELWLILLGHGTFNGQEAKFNLRGPDLTITNLASWLEPFKRPLAIIDCSSASAPFLPKLSAPGRVIITATRSGYEQNYARFGQFLAAAINDPQADLDKDEQTSLLEVFLMAARRVSEWYEADGRLATEHALLDDNGDALGTPADWFRGIRAVKQAREGASLDGLRAHQFHLVRSEQEQKLPPDVRARRDALELAVAKLRESKAKLKEDEYYRQLEPLLVELAKLSPP